MYTFNDYIFSLPVIPSEVISNFLTRKGKFLTHGINGKPSFVYLDLMTKCNLASVV